MIIFLLNSLRVFGYPDLKHSIEPEFGAILNIAIHFVRFIANIVDMSLTTTTHLDN